MTEDGQQQWSRAGGQVPPQPMSGVMGAWNHAHMWYIQGPGCVGIIIIIKATWKLRQL